MVLNQLMLDIYQARKGSFESVPADGWWHNRVAFDLAQQGKMEYTVKDGRLLRIKDGRILSVADNISYLRIRRQKETPGLLELQIEAKKDVILQTYLKIRIHQ